MDQTIRPCRAVCDCRGCCGGLLLHTLTHNAIGTALGGTWGENIAYYSFIIFRDFKRRPRKNFSEFWKISRNLLIEFGPAEFLDSFFIRPTAMYFFPKLLNNIALGLVAGKLSADFIFYIPTILGYEFRKKYFKD